MILILISTRILIQILIRVTDNKIEICNLRLRIPELLCREDGEGGRSSPQVAELRGASSDEIKLFLKVIMSFRILSLDSEIKGNQTKMMLRLTAPAFQRRSS